MVLETINSMRPQKLTLYVTSRQHLTNIKIHLWYKFDLKPAVQRFPWNVEI